MTDRWLRGTIRGPSPLPASAPLVVKVGGSLLSRPGWPEAIATILQACDKPLVVAGGGGLVDALRAIDAVNGQPADLMHALAIEAMSLTARLVADAVGLPIVARVDEPGGILDAAAWLAADGSPVAGALPVGWQVTSDSIAAAVARRSDRGLLLLKSTPPPVAGSDLSTLAASGWVDDHFPAAAADLGLIAWASPPRLPR